MTTPTAAPPAAIQSAEARHRSRVRDRRIWVTRFLMAALVLAQGYASWGTHGLGVWAGLAWIEAWIPVVLIDTVVVVTAHAATAGMLPAKTDDRERLRRWAWGIAMVGFTFGLVANVMHRHVTAPPVCTPALLAGQAPCLPAGGAIIGDILAGAPTVLVLVCLIFRGKIEDYAERLLRANDREDVAAEQAAAELVRKDQQRAARQQERRQAPVVERSTPAAPAPVRQPAPAAVAEPEPDTEPHPITGETPAAADSKIAVYDRLIASEMAGGRRPTGSELDGKLGGTYGRKALQSFMAGIEIVADDPGTSVETLDAELRARFKWANGTAARVVAYAGHQRDRDQPLVPLTVVGETG